MRYLSGAALGAVIGLGAWIALAGRQAAPLPAPPAQPPLSLEELDRLTQAPREGRVELTEAGISLETSPELQLSKVDAGVNRIVRVQAGKQPLLVANSAPVYPWMDLQGVQQACQGRWERWEQGPVRLPGLDLTLPWPGSWAWEAEPQRRLVLVAEGRVTTVTGPSWEDPRFLRVLGSLRAARGGDYRSVYVRIHRAPPDAAGRPVSAQLRSDIDRALAQIEPAVAAPPPSFTQGLAAWRAGKMDALDAAIFADLLLPWLRELEAAALAEQMQAESATQGCPAAPPPADEGGAAAPPPGGGR